MRNLTKNLLKNVDVYGLITGFTFYKKSQYSSVFGGILTVITILIWILLFIYICLPVFYHYNPTIYSQITNADITPYYNLSETKFNLIFRFEDETRSYIDETDLLYTYVEVVNLKYNNQTGDLYQKTKYFVDYTDCTSDMIKNNKLLNITGFKCIKFQDVINKIGGGLFSNDFVYFKITVFYCKYNGNTWDNCTSYDKLNDFLSSHKKKYLSIWFPSVSINLNNINPLNIDMENTLNTLSPLMMKTDRYFYHHTNLTQDSGILTTNEESYNGFKFLRKETEYQIRTREDFDDIKKIKTLSTSVFSIDGKQEKIVIRFKKLQTQLSDLNSLIKIVWIICLYLNSIVGEKFKMIKLSNDLFNLEIDKKEIKLVKYLETNKNIEIKQKIKHSSSNNEYNNFSSFKNDTTILKKKKYIYDNPLLELNYINVDNLGNEENNIDEIRKKVNHFSGRNIDPISDAKFSENNSSILTVKNFPKSSFKNYHNNLVNEKLEKYYNKSNSLYKNKINLSEKEISRISFLKKIHNLQNTSDTQKKNGEEFNPHLQPMKNNSEKINITEILIIDNIKKIFSLRDKIGIFFPCVKNKNNQIKKIYGFIEDKIKEKLDVLIYLRFILTSQMTNLHNDEINYNKKTILFDSL